MAIDQEKLIRKLTSILDKDVDFIVNNKVYLPFQGNNYTRAQLVTWLAARSDLLEQAKTATDQQINSRINTYYNSLDAVDKLIADKIIAGESYDIMQASNFNAYEKLCAILLSKLVTI